MFRNYLKITLRALNKHRVFAFINIFGLAIGMAACILIVQYVTFELSYDNFPDADRIYRIQNNYIRRGNLIYNSAGTFAGVGPSLKESLPEVKEYARLYPGGDKREPVLQYINASNTPIIFKEPDLFFADASVLQLFSVKMLRGDQASLKEPNSLVLSISTARRLFGDENPIGEIIQLRDGYQNTYNCTVTGVFEDLSPNRHLQFKALVSYNTLFSLPGGVDRYHETWSYSASFYTYLLLSRSASPASILDHTQKLLDQFKPGYTKTNEAGNRIRRNKFTLQPVRDIHLNSHLENELLVNGNGEVVRFFIIVAFLILTIAWINYINMATVRSVERSKEVGIRKVMGSNRNQLIRQFIFEAALVNLIAFLLAVLLAELFQYSIFRIPGQDIPAIWNITPSLLFGLIGVFIIGSLFSGTYPAFIISAFKPVRALKGQVSYSGGGVWMRKFLVTFQFAAAIALIIASYAVYQQLNYMHNRDLGFSMEQILIVEGPTTIEEDLRYETFKNNITDYSYVQKVTGSDVIPGQNILRGLAASQGSGMDIISIEGISADYNFMDTYEMDFLAGRSFSRDLIDSDAVIFNEAAIKKLGFHSAQEAVGQSVYIASSRPYEIIGVIGNYHQESLHRMYDPMYFVLSKQDEEAYFSIKINTQNNLNKTIDLIESSYKAHFPRNPFTYFFLNDFFNTQYENDQKYMKLLSSFTFLAIFIACIGLFGFSAYVTIKRTKEIGIRKVLGASFGHIFKLLSRQFISLIIIAALFSLPLIYFGLRIWLNNYAFHINLNWTLFFIPTLIVFVIAVLTIGYQIIKTHRLNPIESLRTE